jgi:hypothetical protein
MNIRHKLFETAPPAREEPLLLRSEGFLHLAEFLLDLIADLFDLAFRSKRGLLVARPPFLER